MEQRPGYEPPEEKKKGLLTQRIEEAARRIDKSRFNSLRNKVSDGNATQAEIDEAMRLADKLHINPSR